MERSQTLTDGRPLTIREASGEDSEAVLAHINAVSEESDNLTFGKGEFELTPQQEFDFLESVREAENQVYLVAEVDGTIVGVLNLSAENRPRIRHVGEVGMTVRESIWGCGVGGALLDSLMAWAQRGGIITKINLRVRTDNVRAVALYTKKGFVKEGTIRRDFLIRGQYVDAYLMGLEL